ncbi:acyl-CoA dehydrogenase family protein [Sporichthya brevicatena]|uniref:Acyl-CoA dehydrogenase family protein n=1 Tax=Sporichthya brevicatena TaxID=171442 RepID=A0ABN1GQL7_9ACTN
MADSSNAGLEAFRARVREVIAKHAPDVPPRAGIRSAEDERELAELRAWNRALFDHGLIGADWPAEYGGRDDHEPMQDVVVVEEIARARLPRPFSGATLASRALLDHGSEEQRARYLPGIRSATELWCQLFSEPGAGSDLASLRTKAVPQPDGSWRVTGQKVWTTDGHWADFGYLLARTDPDAPKHKGISAFVLDMRAPGVTVRPLRELTGTADFNEVFLDDVPVPADAMIGAPGQGWLIANSTLAHERAAVGAAVVGLQQGVEALTALARTVTRDGRPAIEDGAVVETLGILAAEVEALAALVRGGLARWVAGTSRITDAPYAKLMFSELNLRIAEFGLELLGPTGPALADDPAAVEAGRWQDEWLYARAYTIAGGSSEIMRTLIAERGLGLPRSP